MLSQLLMPSQLLLLMPSQLPLLSQAMDILATDMAVMDTMDIMARGPLMRSQLLMLSQ